MVMLDGSLENDVPVDNDLKNLSVQGIFFYIDITKLYFLNFPSHVHNLFWATVVVGSCFSLQFFKIIDLLDIL